MKMKMRLAFLVAPLSILALALAGGHILVWRFFTLSVLVLLLSYVWVRLGIRGIEGHVKKSSEHHQLGESFDEEALIRNVSLLPKLLIKVSEDTDLPGYSNRLAINLSPRGSYCWRTRVYCRARGRYHLGALTAEVVDPFGLFRVQRKLGEGQNLLVYPATVEPPFFRLASHVEAGMGQDYWLTTEPSAAVSGVREYTPGDSLSRIHWRGTAHVGKLIVKSFDLDLAKNIWVVMDMSEASPAGYDAKAIEECCVTIAASLVKEYVDSGRRVGLMTQGSDFCVFPPQTGHQHLWRVMEALATVRAVGKVPVSHLVDREAERLQRNSTVVVITSSASDEMVASLLRINSRGTAAVAILVDTASFGGTVSGQHAADRLASSGIAVYVVKRGDDLAAALDSRGTVATGRGLGKVA